MCFFFSANLLYVNTMNTEANLMSHVNAKQSQYSQPVKVTNTVVSTNQETSESQKVRFKLHIQNCYYQLSMSISMLVP